jgi:hypothetical protein
MSTAALAIPFGDDIIENVLAITSGETSEVISDIIHGRDGRVGLRESFRQISVEADETVSNLKIEKSRHERLVEIGAEQDDPSYIQKLDEKIKRAEQKAKVAKQKYDGVNAEPAANLAASATFFKDARSKGQKFRPVETTIVFEDLPSVSLAIREELAKKRAVAAMRVPAEEAIANVHAQIDSTAADGKPDISPALKGARVDPIIFQSEMAERPNGRWERVPNVLALQVYCMADHLKKTIAADIREALKGVETLPSAERLKRLREIDAEILSLEYQFEAVTRATENGAENRLKRPNDMNPLALFQLELA